MKSLDIIIPTYKNKPGLYKTIFSLGINDRYNITIVDDCSGLNYDDVISYFEPFHNINVLYLEKNSGPGVARQYGIDNTSGDLILFVDTGDVMMGPDSVERMLDTFSSCEEWAEVLFGAHSEEYLNGDVGIVENSHNRLHGKLFKRSFLDKFNIRFPEICSRKNEDLGFCLLIRFIDQEIRELTGQGIIAFTNESYILWKHDDDSLVRRNEYAFYYKEQNMGMAMASCYAYEKARELGVRDEIINDCAYNFFIAAYFYYLMTSHTRPEFIEESFEGALYFYKNWFRKLPSIDEELLLQEYYRNLQDYVNNPSLQTKIINLTFIQFLQMLETECLKEENNL